MSKQIFKIPYFADIYVIDLELVSNITCVTKGSTKYLTVGLLDNKCSSIEIIQNKVNDPECEAIESIALDLYTKWNNFKNERFDLITSGIIG